MAIKIQKTADMPFNGVKTVIYGGAGTGKSVPEDTLVVTRSGYKRIKDLMVGDEIAHPSGKFQTILGVFPQGKKKTWRVCFSDGTAALSSPDHLWTVFNYANKLRTKTLRELYDSNIYTSKNACKYNVPLTKPVVYEEKDLPVDPYVLGCLIGDGYLSGDTIQLTIGKKDTAILDKVRENIPSNTKLTFNNKIGCYQARVVMKRRGDRNSFLKAIRELKLNVNSKDKFIPKEYLYGSVLQRLELLRGLMDTDGSCIKNRTIYHTTSILLCDGITELVNSLGGITKVKEYRNSEYSINVRLDNICPFYTERKAGQWKSPTQNFAKRNIDYIEKNVSEDEHICIKVSEKDGLFLLKNYVVTHNTRFCATAPKPIIISAESGLLSLAEFDVDYIEIKSLKDLDAAYRQLKDSTDYETICLDSLSEIAEVLIAELKPNFKDARQAYGALADAMIPMLKRFRDIKGKNTVFTCKMISVQDEETGAVTMELMLPGKVLGHQVPYLVDELFYLGIDRKGASVMHTTPSRKFFAKDRSGALEAEEKPKAGATEINATDIITRIMEKTK